MAQGSLTADQAYREAVARHRQGKVDEAALLYRGVLQLEPNHADALHYLGALCTASGKAAEAVRLIARAIDAKPDSASTYNDFGLALMALRRGDEAIAAYDKAIALDPQQVEPYNNRALALIALQRPLEALVPLEKAITLRPDVAELYNNLGNALVALARHADAIVVYRKALACRADFAEAQNNLAAALAATGKGDDAIAAYQCAIDLRQGYAETHAGLANALAAAGRHEAALPHFQAASSGQAASPEILNNYGASLVKLERYAEAVMPYRQAIAAKPDFVAAYRNLGSALTALERYGDAATCFERALVLDPKDAETHHNLGNALVELDRPQEALACFRRALALDPQSAEVHGSLGNVLRILGQIEESQRVLDRGVALAPHRAGLHRSLAESKRYSPGDPQLAAMETLGKNLAALESDDERVALHFALAKAYGDLGRRDDEMSQLLAGNRLKRQLVEYEEVPTIEAIRRMAATFTPELMAAKAGLGDPSPVPVFILGMPRSGSTLIEQILASHPEVFGAGEIMAFNAAATGLVGPDGQPPPPFPEGMPAMTGEQLRRIGAHYLSEVTAKAPAARRITDKALGNFRLVGLIHLALPNARIIHACRDPVDTCLSCFSKLFSRSQLYSYDLAELARYYRAYAALMAHWRRVLPPGVMLDVQYEDLVADFEPQAHRIIEFCGLAWDEACLRFHETDRPVRTASVLQVRQPLYQTSVGRWRAYGNALGPLLEGLEIAPPKL